jgi:hypothetical protein
MGEQPRLVDLVTQAVRALGGKEKPVSNQEIQRWILDRYPHANPSSINCTVLLCSVNVQSRVHYPENQKVRVKRHPDYDTLYKVDRGEYELYDPEKHGRWGIVRKDGKLTVVKFQDTEDVVEKNAEKIKEKIREAQRRIGAIIADGGSADDPQVKELKRFIERLTLDLSDLEGESKSLLSDEDKLLLMEMFDLARRALWELNHDVLDQQEAERLQRKEQQLWEFVRRLRA